MCAAHAQVGGEVLPGSNLTPDQAAAAARLLMGGNSLRGMPDMPFALSRSASSVTGVVTRLSSVDSGHLATADTAHLPPPAARVATAYLSEGESVGCNSISVRR